MPMHTAAIPPRKIFEDHENFALFMFFRHHTGTSITPDTQFEAKGVFEDSRIFNFLEFSVFSFGNPIVMKIKVFSMENQRIFMKISLNILLWLRHC